MQTTLPFLRDKRSIQELINVFAVFLEYSGLKPNHEKCEISGIGVLKSVKVAVCSMRCIDLCNDTLKIIPVHFLYNNSFKTLAISKIAFLSLISEVPTEIIGELERIQKAFRRPSKPKTKERKPYDLTLSMLV